MPKLIIDGQEVEVPNGTKIIEAAKAVNVDVPFYCYHPGLSIAGNCRMCLVEVEKMPKLQIACHTDCRDGMVVHTQNERIKVTRKHILEFLLVNHPVDCPVCDQAGECWLQDYYVNYGAYQSRLNENKIKKKKAQPVGEHVMLDQERCILCSRCVRFTDEISKTNELGIINRGDHSEIAVFPETELDNPYTGNVVDLCPVGALTDRDFRFKMRVWYLKSEDSICNGCSRGCSIQVHYSNQRPHHANGERVIRLKPRFNAKVNEWWMCDDGRYSYKYHDHNRIPNAMKRISGEVHEMSFDEGLAEAANEIGAAKGKFAVLLSPQMTNEEIYLAKKLFKDELKAEYVTLVSPKDEGFSDDILICADKNPNTKGAALQGMIAKESEFKAIIDKTQSGELDGLVIFGQDVLTLHNKHFSESQFKNLKWTLFIGANHHVTSEYATYVLPAATHFEKEGTFTNVDGITQKFNQVLLPLGNAVSEWEMMVELGKKLGIHLHYDRAEELFKELCEKNEAFEGLTYESLTQKAPDMRDMAMPMIPSLEQNSKLIFYDANPDQTKKIIDEPASEEVQKASS